MVDARWQDLHRATQDRSHVVPYDGVDPLTGKARRRWLPSATTATKPSRSSPESTRPRAQPRPNHEAALDLADVAERRREARRVRRQHAPAGGASTSTTARPRFAEVSRRFVGQSGDGRPAVWGVVSRLRVLVTGTSGYVGGRLVPALLARGVGVRCLVRTPAKLDSAPWRSSVEVVEGDVGGDLERSDERRGCRCLPGALDRPRHWVGGARAARRGELRPRRFSSGCAAHRVPGRSGQRLGRSQRAFEEPPRGGPALGIDWGGGGRAPRGGHNRFGVGQLRDAALPR